MSFRWTLLCLGALAVASAQDAQTTNIVSTVPRLIRISSTFTPADGGKPASVESVTLSVYRDEQGGSPLWQETQNVSADSAGHYSLLLGASASEGLPQDLFNSTEQRWLGVRFNRPGETEQPRSLLASVPYALKASDADTLGGLPASAYLHASSVGTATSASTTNVVNVAGTTAVAASLRPRYSTGSANFIPLLLDGSGDTTNSVLYQNSSRIGLQTVSPADYLHVVFNDTTGGYTGYAVQNLGTGSASYSGMLFYDQNGVLGQFQGFNNSTHEYRINNVASSGTINFMISSSSKFLIANNGNIGMGVTSPGYNLDVAGALRVGGFAVLSAPNSNSVYFGNLSGTGDTGSYNVAVGLNTLVNGGSGGATGGENAALGAYADWKDTNGSNNTAVGYAALYTNTTGSLNTAIGYWAGAAESGSSTGSNNISIGAYAGENSTSGSNSNNIEIGNDGISTDTATIRIGTSGTQTSFYAAGIANVSLSGAYVAINTTTGQLGVQSSSRRFKEDIHDMANASSGLMRLRPVTFRYKKPLEDGSKPLEYGLIAEEVADVYPELVLHDDKGEILTVKYQALAPMLLNEVQRQESEIDALRQEIQQQRQQLTDQQRQLERQRRRNDDLQKRLTKLEATLSIEASAANR